MINTFLKKAWVFGIILLFVGASVVSGFHTNSSPKPLNPGWLYVGGSGPGNYSTIQSAVDASYSGDSIYVYNGIYYENVIINKTINLIGENKNTTIINGSGVGDVIFISENNVNLSEFKIMGSGDEYYPSFDACIDIRSKYNIINNNWIVNNNYGVFINYANENIIINNLIVSLTYDIGIMTRYSNFNIINGNIVRLNFCGIDIDENSNDNSVMNNFITENYWGLRSVYYSNNNIFSNNNVSMNIYDGIIIGSSNGNKITNNTVYSNEHDGIVIDSSSNRNILSNNDIKLSGWNGIEISSSSNNSIFCNNVNLNKECGIKIRSDSYCCKIYHNNFIDNNMTPYDECINIWDDGYPFGGNYWSDYQGLDTNGDGIGDTPYNISEGNNQDLYPFIEPNGWLKPPVPLFTYTMDELTVNFDASSSYDYDGYITTWIWDFGDLTGLYGENVTHNYSSPGIYSVTLLITDNDGDQNSITQDITVKSYKKAIVFGKITDLTTEEDNIIFETVNTRIITFAPFSWIPYNNGEEITISTGYSGFVGYRYIFVLCRILI